MVKNIPRPQERGPDTFLGVRTGNSLKVQPTESIQATDSGTQTQLHPIVMQKSPPPNNAPSRNKRSMSNSGYLGTRKKRRANRQPSKTIVPDSQEYVPM